MDSKNVLIAIILSTLVLIMWATFFEPPITSQPINKNQINQTQKNDSPSIEEKEIESKVTRNDAINSVSRIKIENQCF